MLRLLSMVLALANAIVFAWSQGYLGQAEASQHEPQRLQAQIKPQQLVLLTAEQARAAANEARAAAQAAALAAQQAQAAAAAAAAPAAPAVPLLACIQAGPFTPADAARFHARLQPLGQAVKPQRISLTHQEVSSHLVYLPPDGGRAGAQRRAADLKQRGVENHFIMQGDTPLRWGISLGLFKSEAAAKKLVSQLQQKGVRNVRIQPRGPQTTRNAYQFRDIEAPLRERLATLAANFNGAAVRNCD